MSDGPETIIQPRHRPSLADLVDQRKREAARQRNFSPARQSLAEGGRFSRWHVPELVDHESDNWLLTYLDMLTLLLAMLVVMLGISRLPPAHKAASVPAVLVGSVDSHGLPVYQGPLKFDATPLVPAGWAKVPMPGELPPVNPADVGPLPRSEQPGLPAAPPMKTPSIKELGLENLGKDVQVVINSQSISFRISNELLFPSGQDTLNPEGLAVLKKLAVVINRTKYPVSVEGHSDNQPINTRQFPSNWELSTSRATSVLRALIRDGVGQERLRAVGYADTRPLKSNATPQGRAANRRVELILQIQPHHPDEPATAAKPAERAIQPVAQAAARPAAEPTVPEPPARILITGAKPVVPQR
ncbi:MAG: OmpA/MotB family protein [Bordetella sp.]|uniref:OmpA/MotB family protein n=1 Tax=Bordetella sp. TaxID=28081 RepID=UPI003F7C8F4A